MQQSIKSSEQSSNHPLLRVFLPTRDLKNEIPNYMAHADGHLYHVIYKIRHSWNNSSLVWLVLVRMHHLNSKPMSNPWCWDSGLSSKCWNLDIKLDIVNRK